MASKASLIFQEIIEAVIMGSNALGVATPILLPIILAIRKKIATPEIKQEWTESKTVDFVHNFRKEQELILSEMDKRRTDGNDDDGQD